MRNSLVAFVPRCLIAALTMQLSLTPPWDPGIDEQYISPSGQARMDPGSIWQRRILLGIGREMECDRRKAA